MTTKRTPVMQLEEIRNVGVVGAGLMGHGIAQVFGSKGFRAKLYDKDPMALESVPNRIRKNLQVFLQLKLAKESDVERCLDNISLCHDMQSLCSGADVIIEAVSEDLEVKQLLFAEVEKLTSRQTILCSNTSGIRIGGISEKLKLKDRVIGTHFWNPPQVVPCVEVIKSEYTSEHVFSTVVELMKRIGKEPVRVFKDVPGFLGNRLQTALFREALSLYEKGIAAPEDIDRVVKHGFGLRLPFVGPFETMDLAGHDVGYEVQKTLFPQLANDSAPDIMKKMVTHGLLGVKTGKGFYEWSDEGIENMVNRRDLGLLELIKIRTKI